MPVWASVSKQAAARSYGATVILSGANLEESIRHAKDLAKDGMTYIPAFDDPEIIAGQGTVGLEILEDLPETDLILVPVGGGGLIAGITVAVKGMDPRVRVFGVQAAACPSAVEAVKAGGPVLVEAGATLADGIRVRQVGDLAFPIIRDLVEEIVLVEEEEIARAMLLLLERKRVIAEGAGAAPLAALLSGKVKIEGGIQGCPRRERRECGHPPPGPGDPPGPCPEREGPPGRGDPGGCARCTRTPPLGDRNGRRKHPPDPSCQGWEGSSSPGGPRRARGGDQG